MFFRIVEKNYIQKCQIMFVGAIQMDDAWLKLDGEYIFIFLAHRRCKHCDFGIKLAEFSKSSTKTPKQRIEKDANCQGFKLCVGDKLVKMSVVPLMFRDWWDELDFPMRTSRLLDQHFGQGLKRDDLMSSVWNSRPTVLRSGYLRPWQRSANSLQKQESGSTLNIDSEKFEVILDVQQFSPNEITVKVADRFVIVEGKHEEKQDEHGFVSRQFSRRYQLPSDVHPDSVTSSLSSDGLLTITAPMKKLPPPQTERLVQITQTGPSSKEDNAKKVETTTP